MPETPKTASAELVATLGQRLYDDWHEGCDENGCNGASLNQAEEVAAEYLELVLPAARRMWFAELFGTPEEIAAREAEPRQSDDLIELCERARPGLHEQRVRAKVAEEIEGSLPHFADPAYGSGLLEAARLARGEQP